MLNTHACTYVGIRSKQKQGVGGGGTKMTSNLLKNQVTGLAALPLLRKVKLKVAPLELPFVIRPLGTEKQHESITTAPRLAPVQRKPHGKL